MITDAIAKLISGASLSQAEAAAATREIMAGVATPAQIGAYLVALRMTGETPEEMAGMASVMRENASRVEPNGDVIDIVGTGGDSVGPFNVSTAASFVVAAAGIHVAKHGNRAMSGKMGSADLLEALGVKMQLSPEGVNRCIGEVGIGFMFAPTFHPATRHAAPVRRELGVRTVFNILGPLTNPAGAQYQLIGAANASTAEKIARVLAILGTKRSWVTAGDDGMDEITTTTTTSAWEVAGSKVRPFTISPEDAGISRAQVSDLQPATADDHVAMFHEALAPGTSPRKDLVLLSAGAAFAVTRRCADIRAGVALAREQIDSGAAAAKVSELAALSKTLE